MIEEKFMFKELEKEDLYSENHLAGDRSYKLFHTDEGGYIENELRFYIFNDGMLCISNNDEWMSIYKEQIEHLQKVLSEMEKKETNI